jgi:hypothetical protein
MKKVLFVALLTVSAGAAFSQGNIKKGDLLIGGTVDFSSSKRANTEGSYQEFNFSPDAGYFFMNQLAGGLRVNLNSSKYESVGSDKTTQFMLAPFVRYYFLPATQKLNVFADADYGFGKVKSTGSEDYNISAFSGKAGVAFFLTPATALEFSLGYTSAKEEFATERYNTIMTGIGLQIHLPGKK